MWRQWTLASIFLLCTAVMLSGAVQDNRLVTAAMNGDRATVTALLNEKADVNVANGDGSTALHWAAYREDAEMAQMLIAAGADIKAATRIGGMTPLFMAAKNGSAAIIEMASETKVAAFA